MPVRTVSVRHCDGVGTMNRVADPALRFADAPAPGRGSVPATTALVALPIYNISAAVPGIVRQALEFAHWHRDYDLVFVDDGSPDGTSERIESMLRADPATRIRLIRHGRNRGKWRAILTGLRSAAAARYRYLMFTDGDLAYSLDHLPRLAQALAHADIVIGCRRGPDALDGAVPARRAMGWLFNHAMRASLGLRYRDSQAGLKGFRVEAATRIFPLMTVSDLSFDVEILFLAQLLGLRVAEIPAQVADSHRCHGSTVDVVRDSIRMLRSLAKIRINHARSQYERG